MRELGKLVRNGNSTHVALNRRVLNFLGWRCGDPIVVEVCVDRTVRIRPPTIDDLRVSPGRYQSFGSVVENGK